MEEKTYAELEVELNEIIKKMKEPNQDLNVSADLYKKGQEILQKMEKTLNDLAVMVEGKLNSHGIKRTKN